VLTLPRTWSSLEQARIKSHYVYIYNTPSCHKILYLGGLRLVYGMFGSTMVCMVLNWTVTRSRSSTSCTPCVRSILGLGFSAAISTCYTKPLTRITRTSILVSWGCSTASSRTWSWRSSTCTVAYTPGATRGTQLLHALTVLSHACRGASSILITDCVRSHQDALITHLFCCTLTSMQQPPKGSVLKRFGLNS
jgi:hypothetical protein